MSWTAAAAVPAVLAVLSVSPGGRIAHVTVDPASHRGTVTGVAAACVGVRGATPGPVTVYAENHRGIVAYETVSSGSRYRLSLRPGRYVVGEFGSPIAPKPVRLHPGEIVTVNFPNVCG